MCAVDSNELARIQHVAEQAVRAAGNILIRAFRQRTPAETVCPHDVKLEADRLSEEAVVSILARAFPHDGVLAEERGLQPSRSGRVWFVDPLDGSVNFHHGIPYFSVSVACYDQTVSGSEGWPQGRVLSSLGMPLVGVVCAPFFRETFVGVRGRGASCNRTPVTVGRETSLSEAVIGLSFGSREETMARMCRVSASLVRDVRKLRIFGSTALDMVHVACGRMSALIQGRVRSWDFAAGRIVLEESGGVFEARGVGPEGWEIIASAPGIHAYLHSVLLREGFPMAM